MSAFDPLDGWFEKGFRVRSQKAARTAKRDQARARSGTSPASTSGVQFSANAKTKNTASVIRKAPEVMVKITGSSSGLATVKHHLDYISRNGEVELTNESGETIHGREELKALRAAVEPQNVVLVLDAAIGQESVNVAKTFHEAVGLTGLILTKLDGDARGGAALSVVAVTGCPVLRVGTGERAEDLELFHPDRMASRILGMGDVVSLVEKVQETIDAGEAERMQEKLQTKQGLDLNDFLAQMRQLKKMGSMGKLLEMIPGAGALGGEMRDRIANDSGGQMKKTEALILSMTPRERRHPDLIDARRRKRIARGSGLQVSDVNELLRSFRQAQQMAKKMKQMQKRLPRGGLFR